MNRKWLLKAHSREETSLVRNPTLLFVFVLCSGRACNVWNGIVYYNEPKATWLGNGNNHILYSNFLGPRSTFVKHIKLIVPRNHSSVGGYSPGKHFVRWYPKSLEIFRIPQNYLNTRSLGSQWKSFVVKGRLQGQNHLHAVIRILSLPYTWISVYVAECNFWLLFLSKLLQK